MLKPLEPHTEIRNNDQITAHMNESGQKSHSNVISTAKTSPSGNQCDKEGKFESGHTKQPGNFRECSFPKTEPTLANFHPGAQHRSYQGLVQSLRKAGGAGVRGVTLHGFLEVGRGLKRRSLEELCEMVIGI